ncbi:MAG: hypothetical protein PQJ59_00140 [Spirochaetales bacterium]|nr:hypothetical protein [Spirochaetales bacterium]
MINENVKKSRYLFQLFILLLFISCGEPFTFSEVMNGEYDSAEADEDSAPDPADADYSVDSITIDEGTVQVSDTLSGSFDYSNDGSETGAYDTAWYVYVSDDEIRDSEDDLLDSGTNSPLAASATKTISFSGTAPASAGDYYLIARLITSDDGDSSNDSLVSDATTIYATSGTVDYQVSSISLDYPNLSSGATCSETFSIKNLGSENGTETISWSAYASTDTTLETASDTLIDSSTLSALTSGSSYLDNSITGTWPDTAGEYYLFIEIGAGDDGYSSNNTRYNGPYTLTDPPDYEIVDDGTDDAVAIDYTDGSPGSSLGDEGEFSFKIRETSGNGGAQSIEWEVYASYDASLDSSDTLLADGLESALEAEGTSDSLTFHDAEWPDMGSYYYLIITITAGDEENLVNNSWVSSPLAVPSVYTEEDENNSFDNVSQTNTNFVSDLDSVLYGTGLSSYELVRVDGTSDANNSVDAYHFTGGADLTNLEVSLCWTDEDSALDFNLIDESGNSWSSDDEDDYSEPATGTVEFTLVNPAESYYLWTENEDTSYTGGASYSLYIQGLP